MVSFPEKSVPKGADFGVRVSGDSMEPVYHDGQIVWVEECETVTLFRRTAHRNRLPFELRIEHHLNGCVEGVHVTVQNNTLTIHVLFTSYLVRVTS